MLKDDFQNIRSGKREVRRFCFLLAVTCALLAGLLLWRGKAGFPVAAGVAVLFAAGGLFSPQRLAFVHRLWMMLALVLGWLTTRVVLTVLYFAVITPIGLFARLTGRDPLDLKLAGNRESYWVRRPDEPSEGRRYETQF